MSIRSKIVWAALGCVLLSGVAANGAEQGKPEPKKDRPFKSDKTPGASAFRQLGCLTVLPPEGAADAVRFIVSNPAGTSTLPVGTVVWLSPKPINGENDLVMTMPGVAFRVDGTLADMDRYLKLPSALAPGGSYQPNYTPNARWQMCAAATGMAYPLPAVPYVE